MVDVALAVGLVGGSVAVSVEDLRLGGVRGGPAIGKRVELTALG